MWVSNVTRDSSQSGEPEPGASYGSGAGHDGLAMSAIADICMLFVRCDKGISHNPAEAITLADAETAARVLLRFVQDFAPAGGR